MSVNPNQGKESEQYGGYQGYTPPAQPADPYSSPQYGQQGDYQQPNTGYSYGGQQQQEQEQVQYNTYQPPLASRSSTRGRQNTVFGTTSETSTGLAAKWAAPLSYLFWWISGLVLLVIERKNRLVRASAAQSVAFLGSAAIVLGVVHFIGGFLGGIPLLGFIFGLLFGAVFYIIAIPVVLVWLFLMFQAYRGVSVRLPFFSTIADRILAIFGGPGSV